MLRGGSEFRSLIVWFFVLAVFGVVDNLAGWSHYSLDGEMLFLAGLFTFFTLIRIGEVLERIDRKMSANRE